MTPRVDASELVAVSEHVEAAGSIYWWRLSGPLELERLALAWAAAGLDPDLLPAHPSPETALHRALADQRSRHRLVRPLGRGTKGWAVVDETVQGDDFSYRVECVAKVDAVGRVSVEPAGHPLEAEILGAYATNLEHLDTTDVSAWLIRLVRSSLGVALREGGGFYFVPAGSNGTFEQVRSIVQDVSGHRVHCIRAMRGADAVAAVLEAIEAETQAEADALDEAMDKGGGLRAMRTREQTCRAVEEKAGLYEDLLGEKMVTLRGRLGKLRARIAEAVLMAEAEKDKAA